MFWLSAQKVRSGDSLNVRQPLLRILACLGLYVGFTFIGETAHAGSLTIESWRTDDAKIWNTKILPVFEKSHPNIHITFLPSKNVEYDETVKTKLKSKTAGDLITCRPFDASLELFSAGYLLELSKIISLNSYRALAKAAWSTDDGAAIFCQPLAVVGTGFFYNKQIFNQLKLTIPQTEAELFGVLETLKKSDKVVPIAFGTKDKWESSQVLMAEVGPNHWRGEVGRKALLKGDLKFTDSAFVDTWKSMSRLDGYMPLNRNKLSYDQARRLFLTGRAAILPAGSWDISFFENAGIKDIGVFHYPVVNADDQCYVTNHLDAGLGINANSPNQADAIIFLNWLSSREFANLFAKSLTGFYPLSSFPVVADNVLVNEMLGWRKTCKSTIRLNSQFLERGPESVEKMLWDIDAEILNETLTPAAAASKLQNNLDSWFYKTLDGSTE